MPMIRLFLLALAHDETVSSSDVRVFPDRIVWKVDVGVPALERAGLRLPVEALDLEEGDLPGLKDGIVGILRPFLEVRSDGAVLEGEPGVLAGRMEPHIASGQPYLARVQQEFVFRAKDPRAITLKGAFFATLTRSHRALLRIGWDGAGEPRTVVRTGAFVLDFGFHDAHPTFWSTTGEFLAWGMHHIFIGYDHIAFLLALLLAARRVGEMVKIVTSFTVAHSITLLLAAFDVLRVNPRISEALIAASVLYVAAENCFLKDGKHRWVLTFGFGLVHGLGFSSVLRERLEDATGVVVPVIAFNVGVELGQIAILLVAFPLLLLARRGGDPELRARRVRLIGSVPIGLLGLIFLIERLADVEIVSPWLG
jgi:hydrogenase/urease accessory protein HupE